MYTGKNKIGIFREDSIPIESRHFYHPIKVAELRKLGYNRDNYSDDETVYLNDEGYKTLMSWQFAFSENNQNISESNQNIIAEDKIIDNTIKRR